MAKNRKIEKLITIEHPKPDEVVWSGHCAAKISAPHCEYVEISIDGQNWELCENESDHWWFDMQELADGEHELTARGIKNGENGVVTRKFKVARE